MKFLLILLFLASSLFGENWIKEDSCFSIYGVVELRDECGFEKPVKYRTLNHEGGMKVKVLETGPSEERGGQAGQWIFVLTTAPMWVDSGELIEPRRRFWIFADDETAIVDYEEF